MPTLSTPYIGVGLRHPHFEDALAAPKGIDFVEFHAENLFAQSRLQQQFIAEVKGHWDISIHGTSFGLGSVTPPAEDAIVALEALIHDTQPRLISEHVCFNRAMVHGKLLHGGDLYPIPYNETSLTVLCEQIDALQQRLGRTLLLENLSAYLHDIPHEFSEATFLNLMVERTGCGLLLDLNNVLVNEYNRGADAPLTSALAFVKALPAHAIHEIHLAGFTPTQVQGQYIDDHACPVSDEGWQLYADTIALLGSVPTLIEWDNALPEWSVLKEQALHARQLCQIQLDTNQRSEANHNASMGLSE